MGSVHKLRRVYVVDKYFQASPLDLLLFLPRSSFLGISLFVTIDMNEFGNFPTSLSAVVFRFPISDLSLSCCLHRLWTLPRNKGHGSVQLFLNTRICHWIRWNFDKFVSGKSPNRSEKLQFYLFSWDQRDSTDFPKVFRFPQIFSSTYLLPPVRKSKQSKLPRSCEINCFCVKIGH